MARASWSPGLREHHWGGGGGCYTDRASSGECPQDLSMWCKEREARSLSLLRCAPNMRTGELVNPPLPGAAGFLIEMGDAVLVMALRK